MNQIFLAAIIIIAMLGAVTLATPLTASAQNMSGGTSEQSKLPAEQNMTGNATNTTITEGVLPAANTTLTPSG